MEENLEISKSLLLLMQSKFFLFLSLSLSEKKNRSTLLSLPPSLSLFTFGVSLFRPKKVSFARNRERGFMICSRRFVSLFKKCFSRISGSWSFEKKK